MNLRGILTDALDRDAVASTVRNYEAGCGGQGSESLLSRIVGNECAANVYYNAGNGFH